MQWRFKKNEQLLKRRLKKRLELSEVRPRVREEWARLMLLGFAREPLHIQWSLSAIRGDTGHAEHFVGGFTDLVFTIQQVSPIKRLLFIIHANTDQSLSSPVLNSSSQLCRLVVRNVNLHRIHADLAGE